MKPNQQQHPEEDVIQHHQNHSCPNSLLQQTLISCSTSIESGDFRQSEKSVSKLVDFLNLIAEESENQESDNSAFQALDEIHRYISSPSVDEAFMDALSFEMPKAVAKLACASSRCLETAEIVIDRFVSTCNPRDMLSILCEALGSPSEELRASYFTPLLHGLAKVFVSIQRRRFEQVKAAVPVVLNVLKASCLESGDEDFDALFDKTIGIANSIQAVCAKLEDDEKKKLHALFGLFVLQIMALVSISIRETVSSCLSLVLQLSHFLPFCGLSYLGLITGSDIEAITQTVLADDRDDTMCSFSYVKHGASLAVVWGYLSDDVAMAAEADFTAVQDELQRNQTKRWEALGMLKNIFSWANLPWELKKHAINFLLCIVNRNIFSNCDIELKDLSLYMPSLYASLQAVEMIIIYAPDAVSRRNAFDAFRRVLEDVPTPLRLDILIALVKNCKSSSMIAILMDCVKREMHMQYSEWTSIGKDVSPSRKNKASQSLSFWCAAVIELVEMVLRPPKGGPPSLPEYSDAVLSALNVYRFVLITESAGKTNFTGVLTKENLNKAYNEWLLPLRTLLTGIIAENQADYDQLASDTICALNPIELVLYRCIELVEEKLKHSS